MKASAKPSAPEHLQPATRTRWSPSSALGTRSPSPAPDHGRRSWDRSNDAREQIARDGLTVATKAGGPRLHPCVKVKEAGGEPSKDFVGWTLAVKRGQP